MKNTTLITYLTTLLLTVVGYAQTTNVVFNANMNYQIALGNFNPATQTVDIAGTFNDWGAPTTPMLDPDADGIYSASVPLAIGTTIQFKTRIDAQWDGTEEFAGGGPNRLYTVIANGVVSYWYDNVISPDVLNVSIMASDQMISPGSSIQFTDLSSGNPISWEWSFPGSNTPISTDQNPIVTYDSVGSYSVTLTITNAALESATQTFANFVRVDAMETFWWNDRVFYEIFVRSFKDSNGDGKGDIQGLISKLDYLNDGDSTTTTDLGITGIWLMPVQQSPSDHGYDVTNYLAIENDYGSNADFSALITAAHARGIKVIIDMVMNHSSNLHPWFAASTNPASDKRDWYIWADTNPGTPGPFGGNAWHFANNDYYYGAFFSGMPDLNFNTQAVRDEFEDIASFWLTDMGVDGFRMDAANLLIENATSTRNTPETLAYWSEFRDFYKSVNPEAFAVGEVWDETPIIQQFTNNGSLDYCFEFNLASTMISGLNNGNAVGLRNKLAEITASYPHLQYGTFLTNHDIDRAMSQFEGDVSKAKAAASLLLTFPGVPYLYYGEEIGMVGIKPDPLIRKPMQWTGATNAGFSTTTPWQSLNADYTTKNVLSQQADPGSLWNHYRNLIAIRNSEIALRQGRYKSLTSASTSILGFARTFGTENVIVISNLGSAELTNVTLELSCLFDCLGPSGNVELVDLLGGSPLDLIVDENGGTLQIATIPAKATLIYKFDSVLKTTGFETMGASVFPVPADDYINVTFSEANSGPVNYSFFDITGRKLSQSSFDSVKGQSHKIRIDELPSGMYFIKFNIEDKTQVLRFVVE